MDAEFWSACHVTFAGFRPSSCCSPGSYPGSPNSDSGRPGVAWTGRERWQRSRWRQEGWYSWCGAYSWPCGGCGFDPGAWHHCSCAPQALAEACSSSLAVSAPQALAEACCALQCKDAQHNGQHCSHRLPPRACLAPLVLHVCRSCELGISAACHLRAAALSGRIRLQGSVNECTQEALTGLACSLLQGAGAEGPGVQWPEPHA